MTTAKKNRLYRPVPSKVDFVAQEHDVLRFWRSSQAFERLMERNRGNPTFSFLDGPITANNPMGAHHAWGRSYKDLFQRFKAMQGFDQRFQNGFDCQGLWVEVEVERELGLNSKRDIEQYGLANFSRRCRARVERYSAIQTEQSIRLGQWMDWPNSYYTMSDTNIEYIWHFLKRCHERGWLYEGSRVNPWCVRCGTSLSQHELIDSYREVTHASVFVKLPIVGRHREYLLVWTTTPWTLAANTAAAVHPDLRYVEVVQGEDHYYLSRGTLAGLRGPYEVVRSLKGSELVGLAYEPPLEELPAQRGLLHRVVPWDAVGEEEGTGIVHVAPGCGAEDFELGKLHSLPVLVPIDENGVYLEGYAFLTGQDVQRVASEIMANLQAKGKLYAVADYTHRYPVCWRCGEQLVFRLVHEWFLSVQQIRPALLEASRRVRWHPPYAAARMEDWLTSMGDWCISRKRYWGLPLPIFLCHDCDQHTVLGSRRELEDLALTGLEQLEELHRPWIDFVKIRCTHCGGFAERITEVGDAWLDAGIVPFSTLRYLEDRSYWERWFPADLVVEMREQIRLWFYSLLFMSVTLEGVAPYREVLVYEKMNDEQGRPMHKSLGNAIWLDEAVEKMGADVMRWLFCSHNPQINLNFGYGPADEVKRKLLTLWNVYSFYVTYANVDRFDPSRHAMPPEDRPPLDRWLISRLHQTVLDVTTRLEGYDPAGATRAIEEFVGDLSNWYLRRSRRRFWKPGEDADKIAAYLTLYEALATVVRLIAPIAPFLSETIYQNLARSVDPAAPGSVHHCPWPVAQPEAIDRGLIEGMEIALRLVGLGRSARNQSGIKVRQPLAGVRIVVPSPREEAQVAQFLDQVRDELNVKSVTFLSRAEEVVRRVVRPKREVLGPKYGREFPHILRALEERRYRLLEDGSVEVAGHRLGPEEVEVAVEPLPGLAAVESGGYLLALETEITPELRAEGLARELARRIQEMRKEAGFDVDDRIVTSYEASPALEKVLRDYRDYLSQETLSTRLVRGLEPGSHTWSGSIDGEKATLGVRRHGRRREREPRAAAA
ncbi:MAG: isoleucine--tRNA ligase [Sphingomonadaceae bacterium]